VRRIGCLLKALTSTRSAGTLEVSVQTYQRWRSQYRAMRPEEVVRLKALEKENARLKRIVGEQALDIDMLREVARGNF
jgi:putative transposase